MIAKCLLCSLVVIFFTSCSSTKKNNSSYTSNWYIRDSAGINQLFLTTKFYVLKDYLFEFSEKINIESHVHLSSKKVETKVDLESTGVFLVSIKDNHYTWFENFTPNSNIKVSNKLSQKSPGQSYKQIDSSYNLSSHNIILRDTTIKTNRLFYRVYSDTVLPEFGRVVVKDYFVRNAYFNSHYQLLGVKPVNEEYNLVGNSITTFGKESEVLFLLEDINALPAKKIRICRSLLKKAKKHNSRSKDLGNL
jgi:hypothetical protein